MLTLMVTAELSLVLPAASRALAASECRPLVAEVVFQETAYGDDVSSEPRLAPSRRNRTPETPTLSAAEADTVTVPVSVAPSRGEATDTDGAVVSPEGGGGGGGGGGGTGEVALFTLTVTLELNLVLPAASRALAARVWEPLVAEVVFQETEYGDDVSSELRSAKSRKN